MKRKNESGVVVVEALIVVTIVTVFITVMLYLGMVLYQQSVVNIMANQAASSIAHSYGNTLRDPFTGYVDAKGVDESVTYSNMRNQAYYDVIKQKADAFAQYRLKSSRILNTGSTEVDVEVVAKKNELLKEQIVVTVKEEYTLSMLSFFGVDAKKISFTGTGRADCTDLLEYLAGVPALGTPDGNAVIFSPKEECVVNFYSHERSTRPLKTVTVLQGYSVNSSSEKTHSVMPSTPIQEKMRFIKWRTADGQNFNGTTIVNGDMNVYGVWECTVTFDPDGGTVEMPSMTATVYGNITLPEAERENCTFAGWYTEKNGKGEEFTGVNVQGDITVYAKWVCAVSFNPDGGEVSPDSLEVVYGSSLAGAGHSLPTPTRDGCTFANWHNELYGEGEEFKASDAVTGHTTVFAKWTCDVTLVPNGGTVPETTINAVAGKQISLPMPDRAHDGDKGWQFGGWYEKADFSSEKISAGEYTVTGAKKLYAKWNCNHAVDYSANVGEYTATKCTESSYKLHKCKYCDYTEKAYGERGDHRNGHCGAQHYYGNGVSYYWGRTDYHQNECMVYWVACWQCPDCGIFGSDICGTCTRWRREWINTHSHG